MPTDGRIPFDRIAEDYDRTRATPERTMNRLVRMLAAELAGKGPCLEIGVGSGRIALPLHRAGIPMAGVDVSLPMLKKLLENAGGRWPYPVVIADAVELPFPDHVFGAGLAVHVLHLIPRWRDALAELARVVRPGGTVLADVGSWETGKWKLVRDHFCGLAGIDRPFVGTNDPAEVGDHMARLGALGRPLPPFRSSRTTTIDEWIGSMADGLYSFTWWVDESTRRRAAAGTRSWAAQRFGPLDRRIRSGRWIMCQAYDLS